MTIALSREAAAQRFLNIRWRGPLTRTALLLMESLWAYAFVAFFVALTGAGGKPTPLGMAAVVFLSFGISRALQQSSLGLGLLRVWGALLSFLLFYAIARVDFYGDWRFWDFAWADQLFYHVTATVRENETALVGVPLLWLFWVRGVLRGQQYIDFESVIGSFAFGLLVILFVEVFAGSVGAPRPVSQAAMPYVAVGLLAIGLAHAARAEDEFGRSFAPSWMGAISGAVTLIGGLALLFAIVDFGPLSDVMRSFADEVGWVVGKAFYYLMWPVVTAMEQMLLGVKWFLENVFGGERNPQNQDFGPNGPPQDEPERQTAGRLTPWLDLLLRIIVFGGLIGALLVGTALLFDRLMRRERPGEVKESTYQEGRLQADLGDLLDSMLGRLRPRARRRAAALDAARRLYFEMLAAGEERGVERQAAETPLELAPRLGEAFATETPAAITRLFDDVRYGEALPAPEDVRRLREEWEGLAGPRG